MTKWERRCRRESQQKYRKLGPSPATILENTQVVMCVKYGTMTEGAEMTAEQQARDMLERMGIDGAQSFSSGEIVELANLLSFSQLLTKKNVELDVKIVDGTIAARRISVENKKLRAFAVEVMEAWPDGGIEGDDLQEIAVKHGMLAPEIRHEPCGEWCQCNGIGDYGGDDWQRGVECYRRTALLTGEME